MSVTLVTANTKVLQGVFLTPDLINWFVSIKFYEQSDNEYDNTTTRTTYLSVQGMGVGGSFKTQ